MEVFGQWPVGMEILLVSFDPVDGDFTLRCRQVHFAAANEVAQMVFERVLDVRVPDRGTVGFGPEVVNIIRTPKAGSNQVVHLICPYLSASKSILFENSALEFARHRLVLRIRCATHTRSRSTSTAAPGVNRGLGTVTVEART